MAFSTPIEWQACTAEQQQALLLRPAIAASENVTLTVRNVLEQVRLNGDEALREFSARFDKAQVETLRVTPQQIAEASARLSEELKQAMAVAVGNIETFHNAQILPPVDVETQPGAPPTAPLNGRFASAISWWKRSTSRKGIAPRSASLPR